MINRIVSPADSKDLEAQRGLSVLELVIVITVFSLLLVPTLSLISPDIDVKRIQRTQDALETARDALVAFAAANNGCLPFAADFEGGLPDTDASGVAAPGYVDTGVGKVGTYAGDLPWADLGFTNSFLDGENLRLQYFVSQAYTDFDPLPSAIVCAAGFRGFEWDSSVTYQGTNSNPLYVYYAEGTDRWLYKVTGTLPAGTAPPSAGPTIAVDVTKVLDGNLLELRRGPDVNTGSQGPDGGPQHDVLSARNVFVLIAPGKNRNATFGRAYVRDSTHINNISNAPWPLDLTGNAGAAAIIDTAIFSLINNIGAADAADNGDDTLLAMSFTEFKVELRKYGLHMEPICEQAC